MKIRRFPIALGSSILCLLLVFSAGVYLGMHLERFDTLCPFNPTSVMLTQDMSGENGLRIPAGTIVPLYSWYTGSVMSTRSSPVLSPLFTNCRHHAICSLAMIFCCCLEMEL